MPAQASAPATPHCVWMNAGLLSYKLCNRGFDCEHCLLDAALREDAPAAGTRPDSRSTWPPGLVPDDRLYSPGHTWLQALPGAPRVWRLGLDAFAAAIIGAATEIRWADPAPLLHPGDPACQIDVGIGDVSLEAPFPCRVIRTNETLRLHPEQAITEPYHRWILELRMSDLTHLTDLAHLASPAAARDRLGLDWGRFCQALALNLLANRGSTGWVAVLHGQPLADIRVLLGAPRYLQLLRDFIH
jgi:glycine cleavage system H lipoate-binding protein